MLNPGVPEWAGWTFGAIGAVAAFTDYRRGKIYNWLTLPALVFGVVVAGATGLDTLGRAAAGLGVASAIFLPLFFTGILGGGDVKLVMAMATVLGARGAAELAVACILVAGVGSFALLCKHRRVRVFFTQIFLFLRSLLTPGLVVQWPKLSREIKAPFGIAILVGFLYVFLDGGGA